MLLPSSLNLFKNCHYSIVGTSTKENPYLNNLFQITENFLKEQNIAYSIERNDTSWRLTVTSLNDAMASAGYLFQQHTYQHSRQKKVDLYVTTKEVDPDSQNPYLRQFALKIGERFPTRNDLKSYEDVYFQQYLPDHSLGTTRLIHTVATVVGISIAAYGFFKQNLWCVAGGIAAIYEAGFHSHLFVEKNIPSSAKYLVGSIYSDLRVTIQTILNPITNGMNKDLKKAGIKEL